MADIVLKTYLIKIFEVGLSEPVRSAYNTFLSTLAQVIKTYNFMNLNLWSVCAVFQKTRKFMIYSFLLGTFIISSKISIKLPSVSTYYKKSGIIRHILSNIFSTLSIKYVSLISFCFKLIFSVQTLTHTGETCMKKLKSLIWHTKYLM